MAHTRRMLEKQGYMQARACARSRARVPARTHAHKPVSNKYCFSTAAMIRERASMLRYTYIAGLVDYYIWPICHKFFMCVYQVSVVSMPSALFYYYYYYRAQLQ